MPRLRQRQRAPAGAEAEALGERRRGQSSLVVEPEELAHEVEAGEVLRPSSRARSRALGWWRILRTSERVRRSSSSWVSAGKRRERRGQLLAADALGLLLQAGDHRLGLEAAVPGAEAAELLRR